VGDIGSFRETILAERVVAEGRKFKILEREIEVAPGRVVTWEVLDKGGDSVAMVAVDGIGDVYLVEEYFGATNERSLCLPKGKVDPGETPEVAAIRELREEIGYSGNAQLLSKMSVSPGYLTQYTTIFLVTGLREDAIVGDEVQHLQTAKMPLDTAVDRCLRGEISEARTVAGLLLAAAHLRTSISSV